MADPSSRGYKLTTLDKDLSTMEIEVTITREFKVRLWIATQLMKAA